MKGSTWTLIIVVLVAIAAAIAIAAHRHQPGPPHPNNSPSPTSSNYSTPPPTELPSVAPPTSVPSPSPLPSMTPTATPTPTPTPTPVPSVPMHLLGMDFAHIFGTCRGTYQTTPPCVYRPQDMQYLGYVEGDAGGGAANVNEDLPYLQAGIGEDVYVYAFGALPPKTGQTNPFFTAIGGTGTLAPCGTNPYGCAPTPSALNQSSPNFEKSCAGNTLADYANTDWLGVAWPNPPPGTGGVNATVAAAFIASFVTPLTSNGVHPNEWYIDGNHTPWGLHEVTNFSHGAEPCTVPTALPTPSYGDPAMSGWIALEAPTLEALGVAIEIDGLPIYTGSGAPMSATQSVVAGVTNLAGSRMESLYVCPSDYVPAQRPDCVGTGYQKIKDWVNEQNENIWALNHGLKRNMEYGDYHGLLEGAVGHAHRGFWFASMLLDYSLTLTHFWFQGAGCALYPNKDPNNPIGECIEPEEGLVLLNPEESAPASWTGSGTTTGILALQDAGKAFRRHYHDAYLWGVRVGRALVAVNPNEGANVYFPDSTFEAPCATCFTFVMHDGPGAEIPVGGTVTVDGPAPGPTMAPDTWSITVNKAQ